MDFDKVVKGRKSVRDFTTKKVDWRRVLDAVEVANEGPFAGNNNHLKFLIVEDKGMIKSISGFCGQTWVSHAQILVLVCSDDTGLEALYGERGRVYSRQQAGAAIQTFLLKLEDMGVAGCWVGSYTDELVKQKLGIPQHLQIEAIIPIGYEKKSVRSGKKSKKSIETTIFWESWGKKKKPTGFEESASDTNVSY